jgi:hypothetical protein
MEIIRNPPLTRRADRTIGLKDGRVTSDELVEHAA